MFSAAAAKEFLVLLKAIILGDKCKNVTHDLICLLASLMENLRLVLCTGRPSRPITTMLGFSTLRLSSETRDNVREVLVVERNLHTDVLFIHFKYLNKPFV